MEVKDLRKKIIGVMGGSSCTKEEYEIAYGVGKIIGEKGYILLCGGGRGVMEAVSKGAFEFGGITIGIMPGSNYFESPPNPYIKIPIFTGMSDGRNSINVKSSNIVVAIGGGWGTLSEIALALKNEKKVIIFKSWKIEKLKEDKNIYFVKDLEDFKITLEKLIADERS